MVKHKHGKLLRSNLLFMFMKGYVEMSTFGTQLGVAPQIVEKKRHEMAAYFSPMATPWVNEH